MTDFIKFADVDFSDKTVVKRAPYKHRRSPIIVTLSDTQITYVDIQKMMEAGMNVARLKTSTTRGEKMRMLGKVDKAALTLRQKFGVIEPVATCLDLKTCVVLTGLLKEEENFIPIKEGSSILLTCNPLYMDSCTKDKIFVDNPYLATEAKVGTEISIGQEELILHCSEIVNPKTIRCIVTKGGNLFHMEFVSMRGVKRQRPVLGQKDFKIIRFAIEQQVDLLVINYVREAETLKKIKKYIGRRVKRPVLISGICTQEDLDNIDEIAQESDAILLSREFLPFELEPSKRYKLSQIQKWLGAKCQSYGKPYYISGAVFQDSLKTGEYSNREVSDVTNALFDGCNGFILKNCDNTENMIETIKSLNELCRAVEPYTNSKTDFWRLIDEVKEPLNAAEGCVLSCAVVANHAQARVIVMPTVTGTTARVLLRLNPACTVIMVKQPLNAAEGCVLSCAVVANQAQARVIVMPTVTGTTARALLRLKPACIVITVSNKPNIIRLLHTFRCIVPLMYNGSPKGRWHLNVEARVNFAVEYAVKRGWLTYGDIYVALQRDTEESSYCDMVRIWTVTIAKKALVECPDDEDVKVTDTHAHKRSSKHIPN